MRYFFLMMAICSIADAQVASSDGRSIVISSHGPAAVVTPKEVEKNDFAEVPEVPAVTQKPESPPAVQKPVKTCSCSSACTCGCNEGKPCKCGHAAPDATTTTARFLISEVWCGLCQGPNGAKARFIASGGNPNNILTMAEAKRRHGIWHNPPYEYTASESQATAVRTLDGSVLSASEPAVQRVASPVRFIQWPGWGTIDLETYNRNCNCSMCNSIRGMQQEYRRQLQLSQQPQTQVETVTPDQEGTPHGLVRVMLDSMDLRQSDVIGDLGCGDGRILIAAAKRGIRGIGIELDPARAAVARANVGREGLHHLITIETGDALEFDLNRVTCATCYLYPPLLAKLSPKLKSLRVVASPYHQIPDLEMTQIGDIWIAKR